MKDREDMDSNNIRAVLTLVGLALAGNTAIADELIVVASAKTDYTTTVPAKPPTEQTALAREATLAAAKQAVDAVLNDNKKDLEIRFIGTTSDKRGGDE